MYQHLVSLFLDQVPEACVTISILTPPILNIAILAPPALPGLDACLSFGFNFALAVLNNTPLSVVDEVINSILDVNIPESPGILENPSSVESSTNMPSSLVFGTSAPAPVVSDTKRPCSIVSGADVPCFVELCRGILSSNLRDTDVLFFDISDIDTLSPIISDLSTQSSFWDTVLINGQATIPPGTTQPTDNNKKRKKSSSDPFPGEKPELVADVRKRLKSTETVIDIEHCSLRFPGQLVHIYDTRYITCTILRILYPHLRMVQYLDNTTVRTCLIHGHTNISRRNQPHCYHNTHYQGIKGIFLRPPMINQHILRHRDINIRVTNKNQPLMRQGGSLFLRR